MALSITDRCGPSIQGVDDKDLECGRPDRLFKMQANVEGARELCKEACVDAIYVRMLL